MNKKLIGFVLGGAVLVAGSQAHALSLTGGVMGNMQMGEGSGTMTMQGTSSMQMQTSLTAQLQMGNVDPTSASGSAIVNLTGNTNALIQTNDDLNAYTGLVMRARPAVKGINVQSDGSVVVNYSQPAKFLGLFSASLPATVNVDAEGNTTVHLPWYAIFYAKDTAAVQSSVSASVQQAEPNLATQANANLSAQDSAQVVNAVTSAIQAQAAMIMIPIPAASESATATGSASTY